jgi:hypothetical protein
MPPSPTPAYWLNKRSLNSLELPASHTFATRPDGWEIGFTAVGTVTAHFGQGGERKINVAAGDRLVGSGEELFFTPKPS